MRSIGYPRDVLNTLAGSVGLVVQAGLFAGVYLLAAPRRGRAIALLFAALVAVDGYALILLGAMALGIPWQVSNGVLVLALVGLACSPSARERVRRSRARLGTLVRASWGAIGILAGVLAIQLLAVILVPEMSIDGQLYHGPVLAQLLQSGTLWGWDAPNQYMYYTDLAMVGTLNLATFTGTTWFDNGAQVPHLIILLFALNVALQVRFPRAWVRFAMAGLIISAPVIWIQPRILYVDVAYGAAVAALIVLIATSRRAQWWDVTIAAIAGASIIAIKPTGLLTGGLLLAALVVVAIWRRRRSRLSWQRAVGGVAAAGVVPIMLAMGFYFRNLVSFGNPVYPVQVTVGSFSLPGIIDLSVFASGDRGSGLLDLLRYQTFAESLWDGVVNGVTKPDYDPRSGGFAYMPLFVLGIAVAIVVAQIVWRARDRRVPIDRRGNWGVQAALVLMSAAVLIVQPATFDTRYVIGPAAVLAVAVLLATTLRTTPPTIDIAAGAVALVLAIGQVAWAESNILLGMSTIKDLRGFPAVWQPITPGNPWGRGESISWLPDDPSRCFDIVLQTSGGVSAGGLAERTSLSALPYGLYGPALCNVVTPVQIDSYADGSFQAHPLLAADFLLFNADDEQKWRQLAPGASDCWIVVDQVPGSETYPQDIVVIRAIC